MKRLFSSSVSALTMGMAIAASVVASHPAQAFTISLDPSQGSTENTGATALLDFNFVQSGSNVLLNLGITNTTNGSTGLGATSATLVGVGFDLPSVLSSFQYNAQGSTFTQLFNDAALNPYGSFDIGIRSDGAGDFAGGNPQQGLTAGQSTLVSFLFSGNNLTAGSVESAFLSGIKDGSLDVVGRFQQVNTGGGSDKVLGGITGGNSAAVPEPFTVLGAALAGGAILGRKKLSAKANTQ